MTASTDPQPALARFRQAARRELALLTRAARDPVRRPLVAITAGWLLLWLAALPLGPWTVAELPGEPRFTVSHALLLAAAVLMAGGAMVLARRAWQGRPYPRAKGRFRVLLAVGGAMVSALGLVLFFFIVLVLTTTLPAPGWLQGDRTGRAMYAVVPLLCRGGALALAPHLPHRRARLLLDLSLLVLLLTLVTMVRHPYALVDGEFFGPAGYAEAVALGALFAAQAVLAWWCGVRSPAGGADD